MGWEMIANRSVIIHFIGNKGYKILRVSIQDRWLLGTMSNNISDES